MTSGFPRSAALPGLLALVGVSTLLLALAGSAVAAPTAAEILQSRPLAPTDKNLFSTAA
jgi:hypothetical protein